MVFANSRTKVQRIAADQQSGDPRSVHRYEIVGFLERRRLANTKRADVIAAYLRNTIVAPFVYILICPLVMLDILATLFQQVGFRLWRIPQVQRKEFVIVDRYRLDQLNLFQKFNCVYCGYANGVIAYAREIASRTELYWCPIKHEKIAGDPHQRYSGFIEFGEMRDLQRELQLRRRDLLRDGD